MSLDEPKDSSKLAPRTQHAGSASPAHSISSRISLEDLPPIPVLNVAIDTETAEPVVVVTAFNDFDPTRPDNWSQKKKLIVMAAGLFADFNATLGSALPSNAMTHISKTFNVTGDVQLALPISVYIIGFIIGPAFYGPLSESFGRKPILLLPFVGYTAFTLGCALSTSWAMFLVFRFLCGLMACAPIAIIGGLYADVYSDEKIRGTYMTYFCLVSGFSPYLGPIISGFISDNVSWRWVFWTAFFLALATLPLLIIMPESYQPILLRRRAAQLRDMTGNDHILSNSLADLRKPGELLTVVLTRPFRMFATEAIVFFSCLYLALIYGVFYLTFQAWPIAFVGIYKMSNSVSGLTYIPFGIGNVLSVVIFFRYDRFLRRAQRRGASWSFKTEYRRLPLACIGGPLWAVSLFWIGWSARRDIYWLAPVSSGITFGAGYLLIFIAILNYLSDAYTIYSASAQSISSTTRSIFGAFLPLSAASMFKSLGFHWACTLLGFFGILMIAIPFAFIRWGDRLRARSSFRQEIEEAREDDNEIAVSAFSATPVANAVAGDTMEAITVVAEDEQLTVLLALSEAQRRGGSFRGSIEEQSIPVGSEPPMMVQTERSSIRSLRPSFKSAIDKGAGEPLPQNEFRLPVAASGQMSHPQAV